MKTEYKIIAVSVISGLLVWTIDAVLDYLLLYKATFLEVLITDVPSREVYIRSLVLAYFLIFGTLMSAVVAKHKRVQETLEQRAAQLALLNDIGGKIAAVLELDSVMDRAARLVQENFGYHHVGLFILDRERGELLMRARAGDFAHLFPPDHGLKLGQGVVGWVGRYGKTLLANDVDAEPRYLSFHPGVIPTRSELSVPIRVGGEVVGVLDAQSPQLNAFDGSDVMAMETLAYQVAVAIENARLHEAVQRELAERKRVEAEILQLNRELTTLNRVSQAITSTLDMQETLTIIMDHVARLMGVAAASVVLHDKVKGDVWFAAASGEGADFMQGKRLAMGQGIAGWVVQHGEPVLVLDVSRDTRWFGGFDEESGFTTRSILCVPLHAKGQIIGAIEVMNKENGTFDQEDLRLLTSLAAPAATAIENARLFEQAQREIAERKRAEQLLQALNAAAITMERALTPEETFAAVAEELEKLGFLCTVLLADECQSRVFPKHLSYDPGAIEAAEKLTSLKVEDFSIPIETADVYRKVVWEKETVFVENAEDIARQSLPEPLQGFAQQLVSTLKLSKSIRAPLLVKNKVIGVFSVQSDDLTAENIPAITAFAHQVAAAWHKATLMQELERSLEELRQTQSQLIQAQKMEAVGRLAGGMAHDFNNILTTILLYAQMLLRSRHLPSDLTQSVEIILDESRRAADLVQKVLDFSRRSMMETQPDDLGSFVTQIMDILKRTLPENIHLIPEMGTDEYVVHADPTQVQQMVMNLAVNAQDAMPDGGELRISLSSVEVMLDEEPPAAEMPAGEWVCLAVSDTGTGMPPEVMSHIFEPFFTTKPVGKGTGLGLAQVYGIVKQHQGYIGVDTEVGRGTTFRIYFPAHRTGEESEEIAKEEALVAPKGKGETILLVEDNERVRGVGRNMLESLGYRVLTAANGLEALEVYRSAAEACPERGRGIDLVITDIVMPEMGGRELIQELRRTAPHLKAVAITGYALAEDPRKLRNGGILEVVQKPFEVNALGEVVRRIMDAD
ncbi:MAG: GAF domain-containing protein [Anaerolineae bacterium]